MFDLINAVLAGELQWRQSQWLWALMLPVVWWLVQKLLRQRQQLSYADKSLWPWVMADTSAMASSLSKSGLTWFKALLHKILSPLMLLAVAWCLLILAMSGPRVMDERFSQQTRQGVDVLVSIDVSRSMLAEDVSPNRFFLAKSLAQSLAQQLEPQDKIGLSVFAAQPHLALPPTFDKSVFKQASDLITPGMLPTQGSRLDLALIHDIHRLQQTASAAKVLLVFTDGAPLFWKPQQLPQAYGDLPAAKSEAFADTGVKVIYIGVGSQRPTVIPDIEDKTGVLHVNGLRVQTRLEQKQLIKLAEKTQGSYMTANNSPQFIQQLLEQIQQNAEMQSTSVAQSYWRDLGQNLLPFAVLFLLAAFYLHSLFAAIKALFDKRLSQLSSGIPSGDSVSEEMSDKKADKKVDKKVSSSAKALALSTLVLASSLFGSVAYSPETWAQPGQNTSYDRQSLLQQAYQAFELQAYDQAQSLYDRVTDFAGWFGAGSAAYKASDLEAAVIYFRQAAWHAPNDQLRAQALYNLGNSYYYANLLTLAIESYQQALIYQQPYDKAEHNLALAQQRYQLEIAVKKAQQGESDEEESGGKGKDNQGAFYGGQKPSSDSSNDGLGADDIDGATEGKKFVLPETESLTDYSLSKQNAKLELNTQKQGGANKVWQAQFNQKRAERLQHQLQQLKDDQQTLLIRMFEREEGFEAMQSEKHSVEGLQPW